MKTRITSHLLKFACVAAVVLGMSAPSAACWFPSWWHNYGTYRPVYYGATYAPSYGSGCSPCGTGGCGVRTYYGPAIDCSPCGVSCSPCGDGCGVGCGVGYVPNADPVADDAVNVEQRDNRTYADDDGDASANETEESDMPPPGDDDFGPVEREGSDAADGDPFPEFERPVLPLENGDDEDAGPRPLDLDEEGVTLRVSPTRQRVRATARYRVPRMARLEVAPEPSPWLPVRETESHVVSK